MFIDGHTLKRNQIELDKHNNASVKKIIRQCRPRILRLNERAEFDRERHTFRCHSQDDFDLGALCHASVHYFETIPHEDDVLVRPVLDILKLKKGLAQVV